MRDNPHVSSALSKFVIAVLICGVIPPYSVALTPPVRPGPNNPNPNPPVCRDKCIFVSEYDFAQNSLQKSIYDETGVLTRIEAEAKRRAGVPVGPASGSDPLWWASWFVLANFSESPDLTEPTLVRKASSPAVPGAIQVISFCGNSKETTLRFKDATTQSQTNKTKEELIQKMTQEMDESIEIKSSLFSGAFAPDLKLKITHKIEQSQSKTIETQATATSDLSYDEDLPVPPHAFVTIGDVTQLVTESYRQSGTVMLDAEIRYVNAPRLQIGKWSDYVTDEGKRVMPVIAEYRIMSSRTIHLRDAAGYATQAECETARKQLPTPQIRFQSLVPYSKPR